MSKSAFHVFVDSCGLEQVRKKCTKCGVFRTLDCFHMTKRKYEHGDSGAEEIYRYQRADCNYCRSKQRKEHYLRTGK